MSTKEKKIAKWYKLTSIAQSYSTEVFLINPHELLAIDHHTLNMNTINIMFVSRYNSRTDSVTTDHDAEQILAEKAGEQIVKERKRGIGPFAFDACKQNLYFYNGQTNGEFFSLNMETKKLTKIKSKKKVEDAEYALFADGDIHRINHNRYHWFYILSEQDMSINELKPWCICPDGIQSKGRLIHIPSKECILLIGGFQHEELWNEDELDSDIYMFSLRDAFNRQVMKWKKIENISFSGCSMGAVLSSNERYIVLMGGVTSDMNSSKSYLNDIFVLDVKDANNDNWKMKKSSIKCPSVGQCTAARTGGIDSKDDILVSGFIKECFKQKAFEDIELLPTYLIKIVVDYYSAEMIHWIGGGMHYGIYLKDILSSLNETQTRNNVKIINRQSPCSADS